MAVSQSCSSVDHAVDDRVDIQFICGEMGTRARQSDESVHTLDILAFRESDGSLDASARSEGSECVISVSRGQTLHYHVIANVGDGAFDEVKDENGFRSCVSLLEDNAPGHLVMDGDGHGEFATAGSTVDVRLCRMPCKVVFETLAPFFLSNGVHASLDRVFLVNAAASCPYDSSVHQVSYVNRGNLDVGMCDALKTLTCMDCHGHSLDGSEVRVDASLYCYPNPVAGTRLVIEMTIDGQKNYYPITLPAMVRNCCYLVRRCELSGYGSDHPDIPVNREEMNFTLSLCPWTYNESEVDF